jgi:hypothetical protein
MSVLLAEAAAATSNWVTVTVAGVAAIASTVGAFLVRASSRDSNDLQKQSLDLQRQQADEQKDQKIAILDIKNNNDLILTSLKGQQDRDLAQTQSWLTATGAERYRELTLKETFLNEVLPRSAQQARERIQGLAQAARDGTFQRDLEANKPFWKAAIYDIVAPAAIADRVADFDVTLCTLETWNRLALARSLQQLFRADEALAGYDPKLAYAPERAGQPEFRETDRQGIVAVSDMLQTFASSTETDPVCPRASFVARFSTNDPEFEPNLTEIRALLTKFHPRAKPVFWRLLIAEALLAQALNELAQEADLSGALSNIRFKQSKLFDWCTPGSEAPPGESPAENAQAAIAWATAGVRETARPAAFVNAGERWPAFLRAKA